MKDINTVGYRSMYVIYACTHKNNCFFCYIYMEHSKKKKIPAHILKMTLYEELLKNRPVKWLEK